MGGLFDELRRLDRQHLHEVWTVVRDGREADLPEEDRPLARILADHPECRNQFEFADLTGDRRFDPDRETNPFLHVILHQAVEGQLAAGEPPEAAAFVAEQVARGADRHEAVHFLCAAVARLFFHGARGREAPPDAYAEALRRLKGTAPVQVPEALERELARLLGLRDDLPLGPEGLRHPVVRRLFGEGNSLDPEVLREIVALGDAVVPDLLVALDEALYRGDEYGDDISGDLTYIPVHALFLLAELGPGPWFPAFLEFLKQEPETLDFWFGDMITEDLWEVAAKGGEGHLPEIEAFLGDTDIYSLARGAVCAGLAQLAAQRPDLRAEVAALFRRLLLGAQARAEAAADAAGEAEFLGGLVADLMDVGLRELEPEIRQAFDAGLVPERIVGADEEFLDDGSMVWELLPIEARYEEFRRKYGGGDGEGDGECDAEPKDWEEPFEPFVRAEPKVGRNEPCPCGSGKKYKKCCGG